MTERTLRAMKLEGDLLAGLLTVEAQEGGLGSERFVVTMDNLPALADYLDTAVSGYDLAIKTFGEARLRELMPPK